MVRVVLTVVTNAQMAITYGRSAAAKNQRLPAARVRWKSLFEYGSKIVLQNDECLRALLTSQTDFDEFSSGSFSCIAFLKPLIPSPRLLPNSGSFFGPNTNRATKRITTRCIGCNRPSN